MTNQQLALIIEDDYDAAIIFAKALEMIGCSTKVIHNGAIAKDYIAENQPQLILLDLLLPEYSGAELLTQIRASDHLKDTLIVITTAEPRIAEKIKYQADLILIKPTSFSQVRNLVGRLMLAHKNIDSLKGQSPSP